MLQTVFTVIIFAAMVVSYCLNRIPMALTSVIGMLLLAVTGCVEPASVLSTVGSSTVLTMISMFVLAAALNRTSLIPALSSAVSRVSKGSFTRVLAAYVLFTFIIGQFMPSTTATVALVCPLAAEMCRQMKVSPSKMLYSVALVTVAASWTVTPIGPYAANYIESNGMLAEYGLGAYQFTIFDEMIDKLPCTVFVILWAIFAAPRFAPDYGVEFREDSGREDALHVCDVSAKETLPRWKNILVYSVFLVVIVSLCFGSFGLPTWIIPAIGACLTVLFGVLNRKQALDSMGLEIIMIYIGAATLGNAFAATGAGELIGSAVAAVFGNAKNSYLIGAVFFAAAYIMTSLLYNRAVSKILIPVILISSISLNCDPRGLMRMCYVGSMCSLLTPMATTAVPIIMGEAGYTQKDLIKMNLLPALGMCAVTVFFVMSRYPCWQ